MQFFDIIFFTLRHREDMTILTYGNNLYESFYQTKFLYMTARKYFLLFYAQHMNK